MNNDLRLKELRQEYNLSQGLASKVCGVPLRTYVRYESDDHYGSSLKRQMMIDLIKSKYEISEEKGILSFEEIKRIVSSIVSKDKYRDLVSYVYLFGSYAKGYQNEKSDIDLLISTSISGLDFVGLIEELRIALHKKVDLVKLNNLTDNIELINEVFKDGIKLYEQSKN